VGTVRAGTLWVVLGLCLVSVGAVLLGTQLEDSTKAGTKAPRVRSDGSLTVNPELLSLADVDRAPRGSAKAAVLLLWYWGEWGAVPNILGAYHPAVVRAVSGEDIAGAYAMFRNALQTGQPKVTAQTGGPRRAVVVLRVRRRDAPPEKYSFTLSRVGGRWYVVFDTLLETAIAGYVQLKNMPDPSAKKPPPAAARAGLDAAAKFRAAAARLSS
jgi:hypothetical protein